MRAINLQTEYLRNPIGVDIENPLLLWNCDEGMRQSAYQIIATTDGKIIWDSGKALSSSMRAIYPYILKSRQRIYWQVKLWDENDNEGDFSETAFFEMGLLKSTDWKAKWIRGNYHVKRKRRYPVDCFQKKFAANMVESARLYISACGLYEAKINGKRVGEFILAPGSTDYRKRIQYQVYDVTDLLNEGENEISTMLADGWYRGSSGSKGRVNTYGKETRLLAQLEIKHDDGKIEIISSNDTWAWSNDGPIEFADLKDGERVDANKIPTYKSHARITSFKGNLRCSNNVQIKENEHFSPMDIVNLSSNKKILKFPQNISGYISFKVHAKKGQKIHIRLGEMLAENGELTLKNIQCVFKGKPSPLQEINYICKDGLNEYTPKFFYGGFQYAEVETDVKFDKDDFTAIAVYSSFEETSSFECSNELLNKFYKNTLWSLKSNSTDLPSDCPTRERMGWTGDSQIFFNTASYMVNYASFARKHVNDIYDRQWRSGRLPQIAPYAHEDWYMWVMNGSVGWACAGVYIPLYFYQKYGDKRILEDNYEGMMRYASFMIKRAGKWGGIYAKPMHLSHKNRKYAVNCGQSYGEWAEPNDVMAFKWYDFASPHPEESTAYTYFTLKRVLEVAEILNKKDKRLEKIKRYSEGAKCAYQELVTKKNFTLDTNRQAKLVRPLYMGLLNKEQEKFAKKRLIEAMDFYRWRIGTGFLSTPMILDVLADINLDYAYKLLENEEMPGWLFMVKNGSTTIWEAWEGNSTKDVGIASLNHYSKGAVCEWLIKSVCGINVVGENSFLIEPKPGGDITYAKATYRSIYGQIQSEWNKDENNISFIVTVPPNCKAKILLPNGSSYLVEAGKHMFKI